MKRTNIAGMALRGGRNDNIFLCLVDYFPDSERYFVRSILQVGDEGEQDGNEAIKSWVKKFELSNLIVNCPLSYPLCHSCELECPGIHHCQPVRL